MSDNYTHDLSRRHFLGALGAAGLVYGLQPQSAFAQTDGVSLDKLTQEKYDYIVVGAGSAGCPLIAQLLKKTKGKILLVEAGGNNDLNDVKDFTQSWKLTQKDSPYDWGYKSVPQKQLKDKKQSYSSGKLLGGTSSINGMVWVRGHRLDFESWAEQGCSGWCYEDVLPHYKNLETCYEGCVDYHGTEGPLHPSSTLSRQTELGRKLIEASVDMGFHHNLDYNGEEQYGAAFTELNVKDLIREDAFSAFVKPHMNNPRLTVITHAYAKKVLFNSEKRAEKLLVAYQGKDIELSSKGEVILCAGSINTPKILMLSGVGDPKELQKFSIPTVAAVKGVGKNLQDHLISVFAKKIKKRIPQSHITAMDICIFMDKAEDPTYIPKDRPPTYQVQSYYMRYGYPPYPANTLGLGSMLLHPKSRGQVSLSSADYFAKPIIDPNFLSHESDITEQLAGYKVIKKLIEQPVLSEWLVDEYSPKLNEDNLLDYMRNNSFADFHSVGTCKMGIGDDAVVDPKLRVHKVKGLRVAGAAIMPDLPSGNTNAPSMMIGDKCGAMISEESI